MMELPNINLNTQTAVSRRLAIIQQRVNQSVNENKNKQTVKIVASTRGLMVDPVLEACDAGMLEFCEDYLPEGVTKKPAIAHRFPTTIWHFAGSLQPAKLHLVVENFDWIDGFDRETLLKPLQEACNKYPQKNVNVLLEVNPIGKQKKMGVSPSELPYLCEELQKIPQVNLKGLSCRSELMMSANIAFKAYELTTKEHQKLLKEGHLPPSAHELAMGSSRDLEKAIACGSTMVRIGSGIFGKSAPSKSITMDYE